MSELLEKQIRQFPAKLTAAVVGCSDQHLRNLVKKGELNQTARGKYDLVEVVRYFVNKPSEGMTDMQQAMLEVNREKARKDRLANDQTERLLIPVADVEEFAHSYAGLFVQSFEAAKKSVGALLDTDSRKKLNERFTAARQRLAEELQAFKDSCSRTGNAASDQDA